MGAKEPVEEGSVFNVLLSGDPLSTLFRPVTRANIERLLVWVSAGDRVERVSLLCRLPMLGVGLDERGCRNVETVETELTDPCASRSELAAGSRLVVPGL